MNRNILSLEQHIDQKLKHEMFQNMKIKCHVENEPIFMICFTETS